MVDKRGLKHVGDKKKKIRSVEGIKLKKKMYAIGKILSFSGITLLTYMIEVEEGGLGVTMKSTENGRLLDIYFAT